MPYHMTYTRLFCYRNPQFRNPEIIYFHMASCRILSTINTAAHANKATVRRLFSLYAAISATTNPTAAEITLSVAERIAGNVMAARHA